MDQTKESILVVDDSRLQRAIIREIFKDFYQIIEAASGEECIQIITERPTSVDLVLLDLVMPGIDGFEVLRRRMDMEHFLDIPVIVLTTTDRPEIQANAYELHANDFLVKPIDENTAHFRIKNLLKTKRRLTDLIQKQDEYRIQSELDAMTGLFNKNTIIRFVNNLLCHQPEKQSALLVIDIDNFKAVNDIFGHTVGDHTISMVSGAIATQFSGDAIVGRIGGDEFVVFIENASSHSEIYDRTQALLDIIQKKENLSIPENITLSIGLVFADGSESNYSELFAKADSALYDAKHAGKSCYSEYGKTSALTESEKNVIVFTQSRNIISMLEFAYESSVRLIQTRSIEELTSYTATVTGLTPHLFVDISDEPDNGCAVLEAIRMPSAKTPVVVICSEGNMTQIRTAAAFPFVQDILFAPLEQQRTKRCIQALK